MPERSSISAFVLAGGLSTRMGQDKASLDWHGTTLLAHMIKILSTEFSPIRIVGRGDLPDRLPGLGPLGGIATAIGAAETDKSLIVAVDLPLLTPEFLKLFKTRIQTSPKPVVACKIGAAYPLCLGISRESLDLINQRISNQHLSVHGFIEAADCEIVTGIDPSIFANVNTPEDWQRIHF